MRQEEPPHTDDDLLELDAELWFAVRTLEREWENEPDAEEEG